MRATNRKKTTATTQLIQRNYIRQMSINKIATHEKNEQIVYVKTKLNNTKKKKMKTSDDVDV